jgi:UDP-N-acetylmuramyl pentapeptide phosphotransferase/UDP-N-acetylglucosamine-1-phosphate transferase
VIAAPLLAAAASAALTLALSRNAIACLRIVDHPNERSLHRTPVPRNGGVALIFGTALGMALVLAADGAERSADLAGAGDRAVAGRRCLVAR